MNLAYVLLVQISLQLVLLDTPTGLERILGLSKQDIARGKQLLKVLTDAWLRESLNDQHNALEHLLQENKEAFNRVTTYLEQVR